MKQIPILNGRCLVVELPEGAIKPHINSVGYTTFIVCHTKSAGDGYHQHNIELPKGNWRIIGMISEVREEEAATIAEEVRVMNQRTKGYRTYKEDLYGNEGYYGSALKSLESAIEAEGYLLESPPTPRCGCFGPAEEGACPACDEWVGSQSRILDRSRCLLLGKVVDAPCQSVYASNEVDVKVITLPGKVRRRNGGHTNDSGGLESSYSYRKTTMVQTR